MERKKVIYSERCMTERVVRCFEDPALEILDVVFNINNTFYDHQTAGTIGDPDRVFIQRVPDGNPKCLFIMEFKTPWALPLPRNLIDTFNTNKSDGKNELVRAVQQIYSYMTFNNLEFGILSNYETTFLFRRVEGGEVQVSHPIMFSDTGTDSPLAALVYLCHRTTTQSYSYFSPIGGVFPSYGQSILRLDPEVRYSYRSPSLDSQMNWDHLTLHVETVISKGFASVSSGWVSAGGRNVFGGKVIFKIYDLSSSECVKQADNEIAK
ncbi:hypothetical protein AA313_de0206894 [Arthrobotrys entomopaga]|nr:hypothetical protein AA313_de0206894 [Arthrobotrys entomopaga]